MELKKVKYKNQETETVMGEIGDQRQKNLNGRK